MSEFSIGRQALQQFTQSPQSDLSANDLLARKNQANALLHQMTHDLVGPNHQVKSGYLRFKTDANQQVTLGTNWSRSTANTQAATDVVKQLVKDAYGSNADVDAALTTYLSANKKDNKLGTQSFVKLIRALDQATAGEVTDQRLAQARVSGKASLKTHTFEPSFRLQHQKVQIEAFKAQAQGLDMKVESAPSRVKLLQDMIQLKQEMATQYKSLPVALRKEQTIAEDSLALCIDELTALHVKIFEDVVAVNASPNSMGAFKTLADMKQLIPNIPGISQLQDQVAYPMNLSSLERVQSKAVTLDKEFTEITYNQDRDFSGVVQAQLRQTEVQGSAALQVQKDLLTNLVAQQAQDRLAFYAQTHHNPEQAPSAKEAQQLWQTQRDSIEQAATDLLSQASAHHQNMVLLLKATMDAIRTDISVYGDGNADALARLDALEVKLANEQLKALTQVQSLVGAIQQTLVPAPDAKLAELLSQSNWSEALTHMQAQGESLAGADLAKLALAIGLQHSQFEQLVAFMQAMVPDASNLRDRAELLGGVLSPKPPANGQSNVTPNILRDLLKTLEQAEPGASKRMLGPLVKAVGSVNPLEIPNAGRLGAALLYVDDDLKRKLSDGQDAIISTSCAKLDMSDANLRNALINVEFKPVKHGGGLIASPDDWRMFSNTNLTDAQVNLDLSSVMRKTDEGHDVNLPLSHLGVKGRLQDHLFDYYQSEGPQQLGLSENEGPPEFQKLAPDQMVRFLAHVKKFEEEESEPSGFYQILTSMNKSFVPQRLHVTRQMLDYVLSMRVSRLQAENVFERSRLIKHIRNDPDLMADEGVRERMNKLETMARVAA